MPVASASSAVLGEGSILEHSQIANIWSRDNYRKIGNDDSVGFSQNAYMPDDTDKNGGPNHLRAWMRYRKVKGAELAEALGGNVTPGMVSDLANSKRALSAKWLRRIAPILETTPGMLLDHDPTEVSADLIDIWSSANTERRRQLVDVAKAIVRDDERGTGTKG